MLQNDVIFSGEKKLFIERSDAMGVQIVHDQTNSPTVKDGSAINGNPDSFAVPSLKVAWSNASGGFPLPT
jgi:hypothetical protein